MSTIKVDKIEKRSGSTLTLGGPGTAVTLACGATQTGFGRSGSVNWCTTAKTSPLTAESGKGYFINTTGGTITVTLPSSPSAGDIVAIKDYASTFQTNNLTLGRGGSNIAGTAACGLLSEKGIATTLVYVDGTQGWLVTNSGLTSEVPLPYSMDILVVAGGGAGGGQDHGGGGGAGGYRTSTQSVTQGTVVTATVGAGGAAGSGPLYRGGSGVASSAAGPGITDITSAGGGGGASNGSGATIDGLPGGSGGGGAGISGGSPTPCGVGGTGNTPPVSPSQGNDGGDGNYAAGSPGGYPTGGGGGAAAVGADGSGTGGGNGGAGAASSITGASVTRAGGGGGSAYPGGTQGSGGAGGGADGVRGTTANAGTANTGGGGGGRSGPAGCQPGGAGGSGVVILSVPTADFSGTTSGCVSSATSGSNTILTFTGTGTYTT